MIVLDCQQGDAEWQAARMGIPTASAFHSIITPAKLSPSAQSEDYMNELLTDGCSGRRLTSAATSGRTAAPLSNRWRGPGTRWSTTAT